MNAIPQHAMHKPLTPWKEVGICSACEDFAICKLRRRNRNPIFYCEEFKPAADTRKRMTIRSSSHPPSNKLQAVRRSNLARSTYIGLCRTCRKLPTCRFTKPGGGTWHCPAYEGNES